MNNKIIFLIIILIFSLFLSTTSFKEGFESYTTCVEQGYPMDFCMQTPVQAKVNDGYCSCADGYFGSFHMDDGKCYCYLFNGL